MKTELSFLYFDWDNAPQILLRSAASLYRNDIAMSFAIGISPEFQLYIMKDYRRLKTDENRRLSLT